MPVRFKRKLTTMGKGVGVSIPPEILDAMKWEKGDILELELKENGQPPYVSIQRTKNT